MVDITVNGQPRRVEVEGDTPLLWVLRDALGLTGTRFGCGAGQCGACTVLLDGKPARACQVTLDGVGAQPVLTIEAIETDPVGARVLAAWIALDIAQCGYCQAGQIMAATALLKATPRPDAGAIAAAMTNLCRCGTYTAVAEGVRRAADAA